MLPLRRNEGVAVVENAISGERRPPLVCEILPGKKFVHHLWFESTAVEYLISKYQDVCHSGCANQSDLYYRDLAG